jgi:hypothetical protein
MRIDEEKLSVLGDDVGESRIRSFGKDDAFNAGESRTFFPLTFRGPDIPRKRLEKKVSEESSKCSVKMVELLWSLNPVSTAASVSGDEFSSSSSKSA